ncbi:MAG: DUF3604 domain-containing protein [Pseudomonadota bacterium]
MRWKKWLGLSVVFLFVIGGLTVSYFLDKISLPGNPDDIAEIRAKTSAQTESGFYQPAQQALVVQETNPLNNLYFGDLHVHTNISVDAYLFGNRFDMDTAYRVAKSESIELRTGERVVLSRPLDFVALTDHAESFGYRLACSQPDLDADARKACGTVDSPSFLNFLAIRAQNQKRPPVRDLTVYGNDPDKERKFAAMAWQSVKDAADRHYQPGVFTSFAGYEYSPPLPDRGKHHRNIIFRSMETPEYAIANPDSSSTIDLWQQLEATCTDDCEFLTIPHNPNKSWGLAFASHTIDGEAYTEADWRLRERSEPLVEMFQNKGNSECSVAFGAGDEECGFEQFFPPCAEDSDTSCIYPTSMARDGLQKGLALQEEIGINPLRFGFIGATDTHNSNPGNTEEWNFRGVVTFGSSPAARRLNSFDPGGLKITNPGGLAAVWAPENTREALFDAMRRKEVYATSGTRIRLRAFAGFDLPENIADTADIQAAYTGGVPMGASLPGEPGTLAFFVWATRDPDSAPLAKLQVIKGWIEEGKRQELVYDIACGGSELDPATNRCQPNAARVDLQTCNWTEQPGAPELRVRWQDPDYRPDQNAFYYLRAVENPTCRWSTYDSLRLGRPPPENVPATSTEMAWSSPIWINAQ